MSDTDLDERTRVIIPLTVGLLQKIDDFRFASRCATRSEAIRRLLEAGLKELSR